VLAVHVDDNQYVEAGTALVEIDPRDYQVALEHARADTEAARATARAAETGVPIMTTVTTSRLSAAQANVQAAEAVWPRPARKWTPPMLSSPRRRHASARPRRAPPGPAEPGPDEATGRSGRDFAQQYDTAESEALAAAAEVDVARATVAQAQQASPWRESRGAGRWRPSRRRKPACGRPVAGRRRSR